MSTYLLVWNPTKSYWDDYADDQLATELGFETPIRWSCGVRKHMSVGSRIFLMRLGYQQPLHGIVASGYSVTEPFAAAHWHETATDRMAMYVEFQPDVMLNPEVHQLFNPEREVSSKFNWRPQASGTEIPEELSLILEEAWSIHLKKVDFVPIRNASSNRSSMIFIEGQRSQITVNRYERDPRAREVCIEHYGAACCVCGFDFGHFYGEIGESFIHVHHLNPIAAQHGTYQLDPIRDLRPVCPNCHAMLHRETPPLTMEYLRELIGRKWGTQLEPDTCD